MTNVSTGQNIMSTKSVQLSAIGQIAINVHDLEKATAFYRNTLGMELIFQVPGLMSFFDCGGIRLMLGIPTSPEDDHPSSVIYYRVADIHESHEALKAKGVHFSQNPHSVGQMGDIDVWMAFFEDVDGNTLAIMSEVPINE
jgi:methylmalonyl-CoA/ethylmalonyl-CoA epimerase